MAGLHSFRQALEGIEVAAPAGPLLSSILTGRWWDRLRQRVVLFPRRSRRERLRCFEAGTLGNCVAA